jgi:putative membrane protein (TIGR04086 family)
MGKTAFRPAAGAVEPGRGKSVLAVAVGVAAAVLFTLLGTLIYALILRLFHASESGIAVFSVCIKAVSALGGGILAARRHTRRGWMRGALCGFLFILAAHVAFMGVGGGFTGGWPLLIDCVLGVSAGSLGGILGIRRKA